MVLWPNDTYNIIGQYPFQSSDTSKPSYASYTASHLVRRVWTSRSPAAIQKTNIMNMKPGNFEGPTQNWFKKLLDAGDAEQCMFDTTACYEKIEDLDADGNVIDTYPGQLIIDANIPGSLDCPSSFYDFSTLGYCTGNVKQNKPKKPKNKCTQWGWGNWQPSLATVCDNTTTTQTRKPVPQDNNGNACDTTQGLPGSKPADQSQTVAGLKTGCPDCPDVNPKDGQPDWGPWVFSVLDALPDCTETKVLRSCRSKPGTIDKSHPNNPHKGRQPTVWVPDFGQLDPSLVCPDKTTQIIDQHGFCAPKTVPGTKQGCQVNGVCSTTTPNTCDKGTATGYVPPPGAGTWRCLGKRGGITDPCPAIAEDGQCGANTHTCASSLPATNKGILTGTTTAIWDCPGANGGNTAKCPVLNGECNNNTQNTCLTGTVSGADATTQTWYCDGVNNGARSKQCKYDTYSNPTGTNQCGIDCPDTSPAGHTITDNKGQTTRLYWEKAGSKCRASLGTAYPYGANLGVWSPSSLSCSQAECNPDKTCKTGVTVSGTTPMCITAGPDNKGSIEYCSKKTKSCYYVCSHWYEPIGGQDGNALTGGCEDGTGTVGNMNQGRNMQYCLNQMKNYCNQRSPNNQGGTNEYCTSAGACPPAWLVKTDGVCGTQDKSGPFGCKQGTWHDIPGSTWMCMGENGGSNVTCP